MATIKSDVIGKILLISASVVLFLAVLIFTLEKTHVINLYQKPILVSTSQDTTLRPVNSVDYTVEQSKPDPSINSEKQNNLDSTPANNMPTDAQSSINVTITRANFNNSTKILSVGTLISNASTGACKLELISGNEVKTFQNVDILQQGTYSTCNGFSVDASNYTGKYIVKITVSSGSQTSNTSQDVTLGN